MSSWQNKKVSHLIIMESYPYDLNSIASHTKDLAIQLSKLLGITEYDAYEFLVDKLRDKNSFEVKI